MSSEFDVVVVGGGGSGLAAALAAAELGGRVIVLEKQRRLGGTTAIAVGSFTCAGTRQQRSAGISDDAAAHCEDAGRFAPAEIEARNNGPLRAFFLEQAAATLDWLEGLGLAFHGPSPEPPNRAPRMHNVVPGARAYIVALERAVRRRGGTIRSNAKVSQLVRDGGRVTGVRALVDGRTETFTAARGVILAAGDYAGAPDLIARFKGIGFDAVEGINPHASGDGQRLIESVGGRLLNMDVTYGPELRFVAPAGRLLWERLPASARASRLLGRLAAWAPQWLLRAWIKRLLVTWQHPENALFDDGAILVNRLGQRFVDERTSPARELATAGQPGKEAFLVLDGRLVARYSAWPHFISTAPDIAYAYVADYARLRADVTAVGSDPAELARRRGIEPNGLVETIAAWAAEARGPAPDGPPWAILGPVKAYFTTTEGGAAVSRRLEVLDGAERPIAGLYAVGQNGLGGMILWGHGLHIAWALTSGRLAGQFAMQEAPG